MYPSPILGAFLSITAALVWGSGDFCGGQAARRISQYQVLVLSGISGLAGLGILMLLVKDPWPDSLDLVWAGAAGLSGAIGLAALYRGISLGNVAFVAPTASVIGAVAPVLFEMLRRNPPTSLQLTGFVLAATGIWLVTQTTGHDPHVRRESIYLAILAGICFGFFFIFLDRIQGTAIFSPLAFARTVTLVCGLVLITVHHEKVPAPFAHPLALVTGLCDAAGNTLYFLSIRFTRLDVATMISSFYPATTVILASVLLHEKISRLQWLGVVCCLAAVLLIVG